jgi:hypothetical protein
MFSGINSAGLAKPRKVVMLLAKELMTLQVKPRLGSDLQVMLESFFMLSKIGNLYWQLRSY